MNQEDAGRLVLGVGFRAVGALAITQSGLRPLETILPWLLSSMRAVGWADEGSPSFATNRPLAVDTSFISSLRSPAAKHRPLHF
jgi:hypothetical protein